VFNFIFCGLALGDVARHRHPVGQPTAEVIHRHNLQLQPELLAIFFVIDQLGAHRLRLLERLADAVQLGALCALPLQQPWRLAQHLGAAVAGLPLKRIIDNVFLLVRASSISRRSLASLSSSTSHRVRASSALAG